MRRTVSVITIVANRPRHLARLLAGIERSVEPPDEVIVVDMGSTTHPDQTIGGRKHRSPVRTVDIAPTDEGLPLAAARNLGAANAVGRCLIFLDVDCIPSRTLVTAYRSATSRGGLCIGPVRYLRRGWDDDLGDALPPDSLLGRRSAPHPLRPAPTVETTDSRYQLFWSLSFGLDRSTWDEIGGFCEDYVGYGAEDTDFGLTASSRRIRLRWMPRGAAFHQWHPSATPPVDHVADIVANANRFHRRWGRWPMEGWLAAFCEMGLVDWEEGHLTLVDGGRPEPRRAITTTTGGTPG